MLKTRSIKSEYELSVMRRAGETVGRILRCDVPSLLRADMSEAELAAELYLLFIKNGYHGISRFSSRNCDFVLGHICFRESPLYPSIFNGASGISGLYPGAPVLGSFEQKLMAGDLVYIDVGFGINGYHIDHTLVYSFKGSQPDVVLRAHQNCLDIERHAASMLRPGVKPSEIYKKALEMVMPEFTDCFMGVKGRTVPFIGHGVGLYIDETPVLAKGFDEPLEKNMTIAIEPKIGLTGYGMTGSENTYLVTDSGGECLTGGVSEIIFC